jgi:hypothetical protein
VIGNQSKWATIQITLEKINYPNNNEACPSICIIFGLYVVVGLISICHHELPTIIICRNPSLGLATKAKGLARV